MRTQKKINRHNCTVRVYENKVNVNGKIMKEVAGWKTVKIYGKPYERGFAHGYLLYKELKRTLKVLPFLVKEALNIPFATYLKKSNEIILPKVKKYYSEYYREMEGISAGARKRGVNVSVEFLVSWNSHMSLSDLYEKGRFRGRCSAFIATGKATESGEIVMAHSTHTDFAVGQLYNIIMQVDPEEGHSFTMQTCAGLIASVSDWFLCSTGIIGCETTISDVKYVPKFGIPFYCRIREAMQYGESLDDYVKIMMRNNAGDYACSWQFGNTHTNEIMLFELGYKTHSVKKTHNGVYYGMNSAMNDRLRKTETTDIDHTNVTTSSGARNYRLNELLNDTYYGKINVEIGKKVLADHYDVYLNKDVPNIRSICKHLESSEEHCNRLGVPTVR